jgi:adenylate cyclase
VLVWLNRPDEAIASAEYAIRLSPHHEFAFSFYLALASAHMATGRYEEALSWADRALRENAGVVALRLKLCLCGHLGRSEEARKCLCLLREMHSEPTVAGVMRDIQRGLSPERARHYADGLRKAGLPEE